MSELTSKSVANQYIPGREQPPQKKFTVNVQSIDVKDLYLLVIGKIRIPSCTFATSGKYDSVCTLQYSTRTDECEFCRWVSFSLKGRAKPRVSTRATLLDHVTL